MDMAPRLINELLFGESNQELSMWFLSRLGH
jgi:hypothetical protein